MIKNNVFRKNLITNEIDIGEVDSVFEAENLKGNIVQEYPYIEIADSSQDVSNIKLMQQKEQKKSELSLYYSNDSLWKFILKSNEVEGSIEKTATWFANVLPAVNGSIYMTNGTTNKVNLSSDSAKAINSYINIDMGIEMKKIKNTILADIDLCETIEDLNNINFDDRFAVINKTIIIEDYL